MPKILIVEDDKANRELITLLLQNHGYEVITAGDGARGVAMARNERPDLIVMDMGLPVLNGWQATHRLKSLPATAHIPIIALTAYAMSQDRERCLAIGCDDYDVKPLEFERLLSKIQAQLERVSVAP